MEIVETGCFQVHVLYTFLIILPFSNILMKLQNLTYRNKALRSPSTAITVPPTAWLPKFCGPTQRDQAVAWLQLFSNSVLTAKPMGRLIFHNGY